ncbi:MAG: hypothetical protein A3D35_03530 [Candidatus Staskawiczbacteria bacterium RIFCSPHIGHO2_02_FULL_34_9]|uniref:Polymer-forming cytoskeletal protein n=1 Tax=Candidatus Staskawiczbacteria bacterium RIFCSPHIGHO2_02_FULL_34_9 TaxID=1802206 RepID=A0A1G2HX98_9BACT|nr:MAG: hypothetical protein A3D35_03530 [Candidatus Staskawiczbacteria bacterium RIFCSPHIGHO2_02_FULL_34_9]
MVGGDISISGPVEGSLMLAGGNVNVNNTVGNSLRIVGGNITIADSVGSDLIVAGGKIAVQSGTTVGKEAFLAGGSVYFDGTVNGNLKIAGKQITIGPNAKINGKLDYYSDKVATIDSGAMVKGKTNFHQKTINNPFNKEFLFGFMSIAAIAKLLMMFVAALIMFHFFKPQTNSIIDNSVSNFWKESLKGFIILCVVPVAIILSLVTVVTLYLGLITLFFYLAFVIISSVISVLVFAKLCLKYIFKKVDYQLNWWVILLSAIVMGIIGFIPFIGWIIVFFVFISTLGSTSSALYNKLRS